MMFEWDNNKADNNIIKHGVSFLEAVTVFNDPLALTFDDPDHSISENRYLTLGISQTGKYIIISHTETDAKIRIISSRLMTRCERKIYEEDETN